MSIVHCRLSEGHNRPPIPSVDHVLQGLAEGSIKELSCRETVTDLDVVTMCRVLRENSKHSVLEVLKLTHNNLTVISAHALGQLLDTNETIVDVDLSHNHLGPDGAIALLQPLATGRNKTLRRLVLQDNHLNSNCATVIGSLLRNNTSLQELWLGHNHFGPKGIKIMAPDLLNNNAVSTLSLNHNQLGPKGAIALTKAFPDNNHSTTKSRQRRQQLHQQEQHFNTISFLDLTCNHIGVKGMRALETMLLFDKTITTLHLGSNDLGPFGAASGPNGAASFKSILRYNSTLLHLKLGSNQIGNEGACDVAHGLMHNVSLLTLELDWNHIGDKGVQALAQCLTVHHSLQVLDLSANQIGTPGAMSLSEALPYNHTLQELILTRNQIDDDGAHALARVLGPCGNTANGSNASLQILRYDANNLTQEGIDCVHNVFRYRSNLEQWLNPLICAIEEGRLVSINLCDKYDIIGNDEIIKLASVLSASSTQQSNKSSQVLRSLYLGGMGITGEGMTALAACFESSDTCIERLFVQRTRMGDAGAAAFAKALCHNQSLKVLSVVSCHMTVVGATALANSLRHNNTMTRLNLSHNAIGNEGLQQLVIALLERANNNNHDEDSSTSSLTSLSVASNGITDEGLYDLAIVPSLIELRLDDNRITDEGVYILANNMNHGTCPFQWLSLSGNQISSKARKALSWCLSDNATLITDLD